MDFNVVDILDRYAIDYREDKYSDEIDILCPFHNDTHFGNAKINSDSGLFNCFSCGEGGNIYQFVSKLEKISVAEAYRKVVNNFEDKSSGYDLDNLKFIKVRISDKKDELIEKVRLSILSNLKEVKDSSKWLIICSWISFHRKELSEKKILEFYNLFNKECSYVQ